MQGQPAAISVSRPVPCVQRGRAGICRYRPTGSDRGSRGHGNGLFSIFGIGGLRSCGGDSAAARSWPHASPACIGWLRLHARGTPAVEPPPCPRPCSECAEPCADAGTPAPRCAWSRQSTPAGRPFRARCPVAFRSGFSRRPEPREPNRHAKRRATSAAGESIRATGPGRTSDERMNCPER